MVKVDEVKKRKFISVVLVALQFTGLGLLAVTGSVFANHLVIQAFQIAFVGVAFWGIWEMRKSRLNVFPDVKKGARLVTSGPYHWIRHPMYASIAGVTLLSLFDNFSVTKLVITALLWIVLIVKTRFEEKLLIEYFPGYKAHQRNTGYWFPGV